MNSAVLDEQLVGHRNWASRRRVKLLAMVSLLVVAAVLFDRLPALLVCEERWEKADYLLILGSKSCVEEAARWYSQGRAERILLVGRWQTPAVQLKVLPPFEDEARQLLARSGIEPGAITEIAGSTRNTWDVARSLEPWLAAHPEAKIDVLTDRLASGHDRLVLGRWLGSERAGQLRVFGLPDPAIIEGGWWRHRYPLKAVAVAAFAFAFDYLHGPAPADLKMHDTIAYAAAIVSEVAARERPTNAGSARAADPGVATRLETGTSKP